LNRLANILKFLLLAALLSASCNTKEEVDSVEVDADSVTTVPFLKEGKLVVLMSNDISSYYILKGQPRGFEYEMIKLFCKENGLRLEVKVIRDFNYLLDSLVAGKGDLAAGNLTVTGARKQRVDFSPEVLRTRQVLVQRYPENYKKLSRKQRQARMIQDALELDGKKVHIHATSSFYNRLANYAAENGLEIQLEKARGDIGTGMLIEQVANGDIDYTVADENVARIHQDIFKNLDISVPLSLSQSIAWAIPKGKKELKELVDDWIEKRRRSTHYNIIYNKYFGSRSQLGQLRNYAAISHGKISNYDELMQEYANYIEWDWLLLAALINKESTFNPHAKSPFGATGLMQVMPVTAERFGVPASHLTNPERNMQAGTRFLQWLDQFWYKRLQDTTQLKYFVLASYNAGPGHVLDAMRLAEKYGYDKNIWHDNVEEMMLKKSEPKYYRDPVVQSGYCNGLQPVVYVDRIMEYYAYYKAFYQNRDIGNAISSVN
jgi:membrane-bound lytic murein transglycosylase F